MITARDLLNHPALAGHVVVGGESGLDATLRTAALVHDNTDLTNLPGGAAAVIDVSTRSGLASQHLIEVFVRRLHSRGGRLLIVVGHRQVVAPSIVRLANQLALPVVMLPEQPHASSAPALAATVLALIHEPAVALSRAVITASAKLAVGTSIGRALAVVSDALNGRAALVARDSGIVEGELRLVPVKDVMLQPAIATDRGEGYVWAALPLFVGRRTFWLAAEAVNGGPVWHETARAVLPLAAQALTVQLLTRRLEAEHDQQVLNALFHELLYLKEGSRIPAHVAEQASDAGIPLDGWHLGVHFTWPTRREPTQMDSWIRQMDSWISAEISTHLQSVLHRQKIDRPLFTRGDGWSYWATYSAQPTDREEIELLQRVKATVKEFNTDYPTHSLVAGVGNPGVGPHSIAVSLGQARQAAMAAAMRSAGTVETMDAIGPQRLLSTWHTDPAFRDHARYLLEPILHHPEAELLLTTLVSYLDHGSSYTRAGVALGAHRNTVKARVTTAESLLGGSLDHSDRLTLHLACRVLAASGEL
ncbi:helix-turn-helix domain-containing protein [Nonomuraea sp. NPDC050663]|uniref:helix-turn-helix domain-containing protein n=1 Tax=Nonomuraea sp. NPDC050663 TaxID=3364370 RepID=UPI0037BA4E93